MVLGTMTLLAGCGDGSSSSGAASTDFAGTWEATTQITEDGCGILVEGEDALLEEHVIRQNGAAIEVDVPNFNGDNPLRGASTLDTEAEIASFSATNALENLDLKGDGTPCSLRQTIGYERRDLSSASSLFRLDITCADGTGCATRGFGRSLRKVND